MTGQQLLASTKVTLPHPSGRCLGVIKGYNLHAVKE